MLAMVTSGARPNTSVPPNNAPMPIEPSEHPSFDKLCSLADALGVEVNYFFARF